MTAVSVGVPSGPSRRLERFLPHLLFGTLVFGAWEIYGQLGNALLLPPVSAVLAALFDLIASGQLLTAFLESAQLLFLGFAAALVFGFVFGVITGRSLVMHRTLSPFFNALFVTPTVALVPLVLVWFGFELQGRVIVVFLAAFVSVLVSVHAGMRDVPTELVEVARSFGVDSEIGLLRHVLLRSAVPLIMSGIRLAVGRAVVGMAIAEVYLRLGGIGALIRGYGAVFATDYLFAAILPLPIMGIGLTALAARVERRFQDWRT